MRSRYGGCGRTFKAVQEGDWPLDPVREARRVWILDADLASAFDKISHEHLLEMIGGFPAKGMIAGWLKAGVFEAGKGFVPTGEGTPYRRALRGVGHRRPRTDQRSFGQDDGGPPGLNNSLLDQVAAPRLGGAAFRGIRIDFLDESLR